MPTVVKFLLESGADGSLRGSFRFKLFSNPKKSMKGERGQKDCSFKSVDLSVLQFILNIFII